MLKSKDKRRKVLRCRSSFGSQQLFFISGMKGFVEGWNAGSSYYNGSSVPEVDTTAFDKLNRYSKVLFFLILPIIAFCSKIVFKSKQLNYAEHLSVYSYMLGEIIMITLMISSILLLLNINIKITGIISSSLCGIYMGICQYQIFQNKLLISIFRSAIFLILSFIFTGIPYNILGIILISISK